VRWLLAARAPGATGGLVSDLRILQIDLGRKPCRASCLGRRWWRSVVLLAWADGGGAACVIHLLGGVIESSIHHAGRRARFWDENLTVCLF
jgi:hypothetical protein